MTNCPSSASLTTEETIRMQEAFYNYNEVIRRTDIIKKVRLSPMFIFISFHFFIFLFFYYSIYSLFNLCHFFYIFHFLHSFPIFFHYFFQSNNSLRSDADRYAQLKKLFEFPPCPVYGKNGVRFPRILMRNLFLSFNLYFHSLFF